MANTVKSLCRVHFHSSTNKLTITDQIEACLIAAASSADVNEWSSYIGDWFDFLSWQNIERNDLILLSEILDQIISIEPSLLATCGKCIALLDGKLNSNAI